MTPLEFEALDVGDVIAVGRQEWVITEVRPGGSRIAVHTMPMVQHSDWLCVRGGQLHVMSEDDRNRLVAGDSVRLQGGHSYVVGVPLVQDRGAATAVTIMELDGWRPEDMTLVRKHA